jgi:hypothetical protein
MPIMQMKKIRSISINWVIEGGNWRHIEIG